MKKLVLGLAMVTVVMGLVGCGTTDKNEVVNGGGFTPSKPSTETVVETEKEEINLEMTVEEMKEYYNDNEFVGAPKIEVVQVGYISESDGIMNLQGQSTRNNYRIDYTSSLGRGLKYNAIVVDNGTPEDTFDDVIAYVFTTPIE